MDPTPCYLVFETAAGFCGIAWTDAGIARFQLPTQGRRRRRAPAAPPPARRPARHARPPRSPPRSPPHGATSTARRPTSPPCRSTSATRTPFFAARLRRGAPDRLGRDHDLRRARQRRSAPGPRPPATSARRWRRNPVPLIIPCHRVLAAGGKVGGFSAPGGSAAKRRMLELEGVRLGAAAGDAAVLHRDDGHAQDRRRGDRGGAARLTRSVGQELPGALRQRHRARRSCR